LTATISIAPTPLVATMAVQNSAELHVDPAVLGLAAFVGANALVMVALSLSQSIWMVVAALLVAVTRYQFDSKEVLC
jgi:hypothetical protein